MPCNHKLKSEPQISSIKAPVETSTLEQSPDIPKWLQEGFALHRSGRLDDAKLIYERILQQQSNHFDALQLLATAYRQQKNSPAALMYFDKALQVNQTNAEVFYNRGNVLKDLNRLDEELKSYDDAIRLKPDFAEAYNNRGLTLHELKRFDEAIKSYDEAICLKPDYALAHTNRGVTLQNLNRFDEALKSYDEAIRLKPGYAEVFSNKGSALQELKRLDEALMSYDEAIRLKPDYPDAAWNKSFLLLLMGNFTEAWQGYEWRWKNEGFLSSNKKREFLQPLWLGVESLKDKTILLYAEQGLGDTIQFCRYVPLVAKFGATVILEVQRPLVSLLKDLEGVSQIVARDSTLPAFDYQCPLLSLPLAFKTDIESIPAAIPYLQTEPGRDKKWAQYLGKDGFKIAICWQGSQKGKELGRSYPLHLFESIAKIKGVRLISLQKNTGNEQLKSLPTGMIVETLPDDFDEGEDAFLDSASIVKSVDLLITCDTVLSHLSGAFGIKTWVPLLNIPDWRWMIDRNDSPWYPNHRLFRQEQREGWVHVFETMEIELKKLVAIKEKELN